MVLEDGSRHPVGGDIRFKIVGDTKMMFGTLEPTDAVFDAIVEPAVMMICRLGEVHWITILSIDADGAVIEGALRPRA
jgi:hypothetical protein